MDEFLNDEQLQRLFEENMPHRPLPPDMADRVTKRVLAEVRVSLKNRQVEFSNSQAQLRSTKSETGQGTTHSRKSGRSWLFSSSPATWISVVGTIAAIFLMAVFFSAPLQETIETISRVGIPWNDGGVAANIEPVIVPTPTAVALAGGISTPTETSEPVSIESQSPTATVEQPTKEDSTATSVQIPDLVITETTDGARAGAVETEEPKTPTSLVTPTARPSATLPADGTQTVVATSTATRISSATTAPSADTTPTRTGTPSPKPTAAESTRTPTVNPTSTLTPQASTTASAVPTESATATRKPNETPSASPTSLLPSLTPTPLLSDTRTPVNTPSVTATDSPDETATSTRTSVPTKTTTPTETPVRSTATAIPTSTSTATATESATPKPSPTNAPPNPGFDSYTIDEDGAGFWNLLANDRDPENKPLTLVSVSQPAHGRTSIQGGNVTYVPDDNYHGRDGFSYTISDGDSSAVGSVNIEIESVNDTPSVSTVSGSVNEGDSISLSPLDGARDVDGDSLTLSSVGSPAHGNASISGGKIIYSPEAGFSGTDSFSYRVSDGREDAVGDIIITVIDVNHAPIASADSSSTNEDSAVSINVLANDSDPDGDTLLITSIGGAGNGSVNFSGSSVTYVPNANFYGADSFSVTISDGKLSASSTVVVQVNGVNDAPTGSAGSLTVDEDGQQTVDGLAGFSDVDGDALTIQSVSDPEHGSASVNGREITYVPDTNYAGGDSIKLVVTDGQASIEATLSVVVTAQNDPPTASGVGASTQADTSVSVDLSGAVRDPDGDTLSLSVDSPANGSVSVNGFNVTYTPNAGFSGGDSFNFTVSDGTSTATASVSISVSAVAQETPTETSTPQPTETPVTVAQTETPTVESHAVNPTETPVP